MAKLYPPIISGTLPAFYLEESGTDRFIKITVPFSMNRAVSPVQVKGFSLKIKSVQSSNYLYTITETNPLFFEMEDSAWVTFTLRTSNSAKEREFIVRDLKVGLFYKLQLAYIDTNNEVGNYSTVGISKYTTQPTVTINDFKMGMTNTHKYTYYGFYNQENGDVTEKVYSYRFDIYNNYDVLIASSGDQVHNVNNDTELRSSYDRYDYNKDLELNKVYKIQYTVTTNNNLIVQSPRYRIMQRTTIEPDLKADLVASVNFDNGYVDVGLVGHKNDEGVEDIVTGSFVLARACEDSNYLKWEEISRFKLIAQFATRDLWKDFTAQQGKHYKYSIQQYNDKQLYSNRIISNEIYSDFEDAFLYDGTRQLKIKYNPKIGNIKTNILEQKTDTLGHKYPFFYRNGNVNYKEFSIAGLISYFMDNDSFFLTEDEFNVEYPTTNLIGENLSAERTFKMKVLDWLNNGKPKLFRSPTEGNFIVRLMKVTLAPENKLGRMLHTFNSTAYEIADFNYENLAKYDFIHIDNGEKQYMRWETIEFLERNSDGTPKYRAGEVLNKHPAQTVRFVNMRPGQMVTITFEDDKIETVMIGATGSYYIDEGVAIRSIVLGEENPYLPGYTLTDDPYLSGSMTYSYLSLQSNLFDKIADIQVTEIPTQQFIGEHDIVQEIEWVEYNGQYYRNPKIDILEFYHINVQKRTEEKIVYDGNKYYTDNNKTNLFDITKADPFTLYKVGSGYTASPSGSKGNGYNPYRAQWTFNALYYRDVFNDKSYNLDTYNPYVIIDGNQVSVQDISNFDFHRPGKITSLVSGNATNVEVSYQIRIIDYLIEEDETYPDLYQAKKSYINIKSQLERYYEILSFFNGLNEDNTLLEEERDAILFELKTKFENDTAKYNEEKENIILSYANEATVAEQEYQTKRAALESEIAWREEMFQSEIIREELFQYRQALNVLDYEYRQNKIAKEEEMNKLIANLDYEINLILNIYNEDVSYYSSKYKTQIDELSRKRIELIDEAKLTFGFDPTDFTIEKAQEYYIAIEKPMREGLRQNYNKYIYELVRAKKEEKEAEGLL